MAKQKKFNYFEAFEKQVEIATEESNLLIEAVKSFSPEADMHDLFKRAHDIEHEGDMMNRDIISSVAADFITPIDREDIVELAADLDDITDLIEGIMQRFYMFNIQEIHPAVMQFAVIINKSLKALQKAMGPFSEFKKLKKIAHIANDVSELEEEADALYIKAIRDLYIDNASDSLYVLTWTRLFSRLEETCDSCKKAADKMSTIMLKNV